MEVSEKADKKILKQCLVCGKALKLSIGHKKFSRTCSYKCMGMMKRKRRKFSCLVCGKEREVLTTNINAKFCSHKCYSKSKEKKLYGVCRVCHKTFSYQPYRINDNKGKHPTCCSNKCFTSTQFNGEFRNCITCGQQFYVSQWYIKQGYGKYCSHKCLDTGKVPLIRRIRRAVQYKEWRKLVLQRDNHICQICGADDLVLDVHHIWGLRMILEENNITTLDDAKKCEKLWEISNGLTLCTVCHDNINCNLEWQYRNRVPAPFRVITPIYARVSSSGHG